MENRSGSAAGLENHVDLVVDRGTVGSFNDWAGFTPTTIFSGAFLATLADINGNYAEGGRVGLQGQPLGRAPSTAASGPFDDDGLTQPQLDALQGARVSIDLIRELQSSDPAA